MELKYFERDVYQDILDWASKRDTALLLSGPRQVGKTYLLKKLGAEYFERCVYVNLMEEDESNRLDGILKRHYDNHSGSSGTFPWEVVWAEFDSAYVNAPSTLVVIDEIQESSAWYNRIRSLRRELKSRLAVTGSYLGRTKNLSFKVPAGDLSYLEMGSLSYVEFLKANGIYDEYNAIKSFDKIELSEQELEVYRRVEKLYDVYCLIGGYPTVVQKWTGEHSIEECLTEIQTLITVFQDECSRYFDAVINDFLWNKAMVEVTKSIISRATDLGRRDGELAQATIEIKLQPTNEYTMARKDKIAALSWLSDAALIGIVGVIDDIKFKTESNTKFRFYVRDMGILNVISDRILGLQESDLAGMRAENFVYLYLQDKLKKDFNGYMVMNYTEPNSQAEIDFIIGTKNRDCIGIEVKASHGKVKSGDDALKANHISKLIKVQDSFGGVTGDKITIPIFAIDKILSIL